MYDNEFFINELSLYGDLSVYVEFCINNNQTQEKYKTQRHHILPRALFPQYSSWNNKWNIVNLSNSNHYIAHCLFCKFSDNELMLHAWYAMNNMNFIDTCKPIELIGSGVYDELITKRNKMVSKNAKNKVTAKNVKTGEYLRVTKDEFYMNDDLVGTTAGDKIYSIRHTFTVKEGDKYIRVKQCDYDPSKHTHMRSGICTYKDKDGNLITTTTNDPRVISGELVGYNKGKHFDFSKFWKMYQIFDNNNTLVYEVNGSSNFCRLCKKYKLPKNRLIKSAQENNEINFEKEFFNKSNSTIAKIKKGPYYKFNGWYMRYGE